MTPTLEQLLVLDTSSIHRALQVINQTAQGFAIVVDEDGMMCGLLSDGDIRRKLISGMSIYAPVSHAMSRNFVALSIDVPVETLQNTLNDKIKFVPLLDSEGRPVDYSSHHRIKSIQFSSSVMTGNELAYVTDCVRTNNIGNFGKYIRRFERKFGNEYQTTFAAATSSASAAMQIVLAAHGFGENQEIILSDLADSSIADAILLVGAVPKLVDINLESWTLDSRSVEASITSRTRAIIASHVYGVPCDIDKLAAISKQYGLILIEDCSQAIGSSVKGIKVGLFGDAAVFCFGNNKTLTTGEGGLMIFKKQDAYDRGISLLNEGRIEFEKNQHQVIGQNYRMTNLQSAIGLAQLEQLTYFLEKRRVIVKKYTEIFRLLQGIILPADTNGDQISYDAFPVVLSEETRVSRNEMLVRLHLAGIESHPFFRPLHQIEYYKSFGNREQLKCSRKISDSGLTLPSASTLNVEHINIICNIFESIFFKRKKNH